jgi:hypothetical protein
MQKKDYFIKIGIIVIVLAIAAWIVTNKIISDSNAPFGLVMLWPALVIFGIPVLIFILLWLIDFFKK